MKDKLGHPLPNQLLSHSTNYERKMEFDSAQWMSRQFGSFEVLGASKGGVLDILSE